MRSNSWVNSGILRNKMDHGINLLAKHIFFIVRLYTIYTASP